MHVRYLRAGVVRLIARVDSDFGSFEEALLDRVNLQPCVQVHHL